VGSREGGREGGREGERERVQSSSIRNDAAYGGSRASPAAPAPHHHGDDLEVDCSDIGLCTPPVAAGGCRRRQCLAASFSR
jgi:hypothetical protein